MAWLFCLLSPATVIGLIVTSYWGRVVKLVLKQRRLTGRKHNFLPPELLGRIIRIVWYPTVAAWIIFSFLSLLKHSGPFIRPFFDQPLIQWPAAGLAAVDLWLTMICWRKMGRDWRMGIDPTEKNNLISTGPYAYVRHPIYALQIVLVWLSFIAVGSYALLGVACLQTFFLTWEALREERHLTTQLGDAYSSYMSTTGRFLPRVIGRQSLT